MELQQRQEEKGVSLEVLGSYVGQIRVSSESLGKFLWVHRDTQIP